MIKPRLLFSTAVIFLAFVMVFLTALRISQPSPSSETSTINPTLNKKEIMKNYEASQSAFLNTNKNIKNPLPYPGILPNHPLYWLKMVRDRVLLTLKNNPAQRYEFLLFLANKRLSAGQSLINSQQQKLGVSTISKAEKYLHQASQEAKLLSNREKAQLLDTYLVHKEIITILKDHVSDWEKLVLQDSIVLNENILEYQTKPSILKKPETKKTATSSAEKLKTP